MALGKIDPKKLWQGLKKYRYAALVLLLGLALLLLPGGKKTQKSAAAPTTVQTDYAAETEQAADADAAADRGRWAGQRDADAGDRGARGYQTDVQASSDGAQSSESRKTVILSEGSSYDKAGCSRDDLSAFSGRAHRLRGGGQRAVRLGLLEAVSAVTGLSTDRITVVKMRS